MSDNIILGFFEKLNKYTADDIDLIIENTTTENFKRGDVILHEGKVCEKCFLVLKGCVRQFKIVQGSEKTSAFYFEGDPVIAYSSYLEGKPSPYSFQCLEDSILVSGKRETELNMHMVNTRLEYLTHTIMVDDYKKVEAYISLLNNYAPEERYQLLLKNHNEIVSRVPLVYIASYLGITPESLSRIRKRIVVKKT